MDHDLWVWGMFSWLKRTATSAHGITVIGRDLDLLIKMSTRTAAQIIAEQIDTAERSMNRRCSSEPATRFAVDEFISGYAIGLVMQLVVLNGRQVSEIQMKKLMPVVQKELEQFLPGIDVNGGPSEFEPNVVRSEVGHE